MRNQQHNIRLNTCIAAFFLFFTLTFSLASAQEVVQSVDLSIRATPEYPSAGQTVTLEAISYGTDLSQARLSWTYGGKAILSGIGATRATVTAPGNGQVATATVSVSANGLAPFAATLTVRPGSLDLLWEGVSASVPPFYKGRALPGAGGLIRITAIPASSAPKGVSYQWTRGDSALPAASGYGASSIVIEHGLFEASERIGVQARAGVYEGRGLTSITPRNQTLIAYQKSGGFIDFSSGSEASILISGPGAIVRFEPFFFSLAHRSLDELVMTVRSGDAVLYNEVQNETPVSRPDEGGQGALSVDVSTKNYSLQHARSNFRLFFQ